MAGLTPHLLEFRSSLRTTVPPILGDYQLSSWFITQGRTMIHRLLLWYLWPVTESQNINQKKLKLRNTWTKMDWSNPLAVSYSNDTPPNRSVPIQNTRQKSVPVTIRHHNTPNQPSSWRLFIRYCSRHRDTPLAFNRTSPATKTQPLMSAINVLKFGHVSHPQRRILTGVQPRKLLLMSCCYTDKSGMRHTTAESTSVLEHTCSVSGSVYSTKTYNHNSPSIKLGRELLCSLKIMWHEAIKSVYLVQMQPFTPWPTAVCCIDAILNKVVGGKKWWSWWNSKALRKLCNH